MYKLSSKLYFKQSGDLYLLNKWKLLFTKAGISLFICMVSASALRPRSIHSEIRMKRFLRIVGIKGEDVNRRTRTVIIGSIKLESSSLATMIEIDHYDSDVVVKMPSYTLLYLLYIVVS